MEGVSPRQVLAQPAADFTPRRPIKTALHQAVLDGRIHQVRLLVDKHGGNVNSKDMYGKTPVMLACLVDNELIAHKMVRIFVKAGARMNRTDKLRRTALHYACMKGREDIVRYLLNEDSVEVNAADNDGNTPLMLAAINGNSAIVELLVENMVRFGISTDQRNGLGYTALLLACKFGNYVSAHVLVTKGQAQPALRDTEFFLNAEAWVKKSSAVNRSFSAKNIQISARRPKFADTIMSRANTSLSRENTTLSRENSPYSAGITKHVCRHVSKPFLPVGSSFETTIHLPALRTPCSGAKTAAKSDDCADARITLLKEIAACKEATQEGQLPRSKSSFLRASSAKLLALSRSHTVMVPNIRTLFRLYAEQHGVTKVPHTPPTVATPPTPPRPKPDLPVFKIQSYSSDNNGALSTIIET